MQVSVGHSHAALVTDDSRLYVWGHTVRHRLGLGTLVNAAAPPQFKHYFLTPTAVPLFSKIKVRKVRDALIGP